MTTDERQGETASKFNVLTGIERNGAKMDKATLTALQGSIAKWEAIVAGKGSDLGPNNCPLCKAFRIAGEGPVTCDGCPVKEATGLHGCNGTPYDRYADTGSMKHARAELDFLRGLLPTAPVIAEQREVKS